MVTAAELKPLQSELYEKLRSKLVTQYPSMRKKYNNYEIPT